MRSLFLVILFSTTIISYSQQTERATFEKLTLKPKKSAAKTNGTLQLTVVEYMEKGNSDDSKNTEKKEDLISTGTEDEEFLTPLEKTPDHDLLGELKAIYTVSSWTVNGIENGNSTVGTISGAEKLTAVYNAPTSVPDQNPVAVTAKITGISYTPAGGKKMRTLYLTANIDIYDNGYQFTFIQASSNIGGVFKQLDSTTCLITIDKGKPVLKNIINHKPWSDWPRTNKRGCPLEYPSPDSWKGQTEIWGMTGGMLTPASEKNPLTDIVIQLAPAFGNSPEIIEDCKCRGCRRHMPAMPLPAQPKYIHFTVKDEEINIEYMGVWGRNEIENISKGEGFAVKIAKL
ncbi:MAG: hypothetical protein JNK79_18825 [Chitinophagaceae bacterium]|nr:hypothetical protein [Chitinophagaceae bacterium]